MTEPASAAGVEVIAVRYATTSTSRSKQYFRYAAYGQPDAPMDLDYYFWVVRAGDDIMLVDTGFNPEAGAKRAGRELIIPPVEALRTLGIDPDQVSRVVITHCHYDHIGNLMHFPEARFTVQSKELEFWTGPYATRPAVAAAVERSEIEFLQDAVRRGRVDVAVSHVAVTEQMTAILVGGHCPGQQVVSIGHDQPIVLCSDAVHFYDELTDAMPHHGVFDLVAMYRSYELISEMARDDDAVIVPGHDTAVMSKFPAVPGHEGLAVLLG